MLHKGAVGGLLSLLSHDSSEQECVVVALDALFQLACVVNADFAADDMQNFISTTPNKLFLASLRDVPDSLPLIRTFVPSNNPPPVRLLARKLCRFLPNSGRKWWKYYYCFSSNFLSRCFLPKYLSNWNIIQHMKLETRMCLIIWSQTG